jgi:hypothetical protein
MSEPTAYPLAWPAGRPRRPDKDRKVGRFTHDGRWISRDQAAKRVLAELKRLGGTYPLISSNVRVRKDGLPYAKDAEREPDDRAVCLYFMLDGQPFALACDRYTEVADNLAAIAAHIEATRAIERHGVASAAETLQAFSALPPPPPGGSIIIGQAVKPWHEVLGVAPSAPTSVIEAAYRALARKAHPDAGGSADEMAALNQARDAGLKARSE